MNGVCVLKDCWKRQGSGDETVSVCGSGCVLGENGSCVNICNNEKHYEVDISGRCVIRDCEKRSVDNSLGRVCGISCYESEDGEGCKSSCSNEYHYETNIKGRCVEKPCLSRSVDENNIKGVCGSGSCYGEEGSTSEGPCAEECTNPKFLIN
jgi:hypothetical protein